MKLKLTNIFALILFFLFSCQGSSSSESFDDNEEITYECASCGAIITQSMLENGEAFWVENSNSPSGVDHVCAKHSDSE